MIRISNNLKKILNLKKPSSSQFLRIFVRFKSDIDKAWKSSVTYRTYPKFRKQVKFLVKIDSNKSVKVFVIVKLPKFVDEQVETKEKKDKKLLYSSARTEKSGGIKLRYLSYKKLDKNASSDQKRKQSYLSTLRQRAQEAQKKLKKKKDFGVKEKASTWGTGGRFFQSNKIAKTFGTGDKTFRENKKVLSWGTKTTYKDPRKNSRWGTSRKVLDLDTNSEWGSERDSEKKTQEQDNSQDIRLYKNFIYSLNKETFIEKVMRDYATRLVNFLISGLK